MNIRSYDVNTYFNKFRILFLNQINTNIRKKLEK